MREKSYSLCSSTHATHARVPPTRSAMGGHVTRESTFASRIERTDIGRGVESGRMIVCVASAARVCRCVCRCWVTAAGSGLRSSVRLLTVCHARFANACSHCWRVSRRLGHHARGLGLSLGSRDSPRPRSRVSGRRGHDARVLASRVASGLVSRDCACRECRLSCRCRRRRSLTVTRHGHAMVTRGAALAGGGTRRGAHVRYTYT
jgi:hypothetical protein